MNRLKGLFLCVPIGVMALMTMLPLSAAETAKKPSIDPAATEILQKMSNYLSGLNSFKVHVQTTREIILATDQELDTDHSFDLTVQRPNHVLGIAQSAAGGRQFFYDGTNFTIFTPKANYYATFAAPHTIEGVLKEVATKYGLELPIADFIVSNPYQILAKNIKSAMHVGMSLVDGVLCHQIAVRQKNVDWQLWIDDGPSPLPRRFVITDKAQAGEPRFTAQFSGWDVNPTIDASVFTFVPPQGAKKIGIVNMQELMKKGAQKGKLMPGK